LKKRYSCPICEDEKYVLDPVKGTVRCSCLEQEKFNRRLIEAGVTFPKGDLTFKNINARFPHTDIDTKTLKFSEDISNVFRVGERPLKIWCFQGTANGAKDLIVQTTLLGAVEGGLSVNQCSMEQLISNHFQGGEISLENEFTKSDIMCLHFGSELQYNVSGNFLQSLIRLNWLLPKNSLLLHTNLRWEDIAYKYGDNVQNLFIRSYEKLLDPERRIVFCCVEDK
jgi:hypothetical protein